MNWFTYLRRTPLAQIRADLTEYMKLRKDCAMLHKLQNEAYDKLIKKISYDSEKLPEQSCIRQTYCCGSSQFKFAGNHQMGEMLLIMQSSCRNFYEGGNDAKCAKSNCPFIGLNHEYAEACERYNLMRQAQSDFWQKKFGQASERTK